MDDLFRGKTYPVHPAAEIFPMMADEQLEELAADIKANGLIHPIVLGEWADDDGVVHDGIIDGRNRLRACEIAKVEPQFERLNGEDPRAFIVSANIERRNLNKGQQVTALALIYPNPDERGRGKNVYLITFFTPAAVARTHCCALGTRAGAADHGAG
jgi:hypothetical protein